MKAVGKSRRRLSNIPTARFLSVEKTPVSADQVNTAKPCLRALGWWTFYFCLTVASGLIPRPKTSLRHKLGVPGCLLS